MVEEHFNACEYLLDRRIASGDRDRLAITGVAGDLSYGQLLERVERTARVLVNIGLQPEQRLMMFMADSPDFLALYLAAMRIGSIPVPVSTMLRPEELGELLRDSRARLLAITPELGSLALASISNAPELCGIVAASNADLLREHSVPIHDLEILVGSAIPLEEVYGTTADSPAFWLYTSGTTGHSKAAIHRHGAVATVCETYGAQVLRIRRDDRCLSAAKAFFAYGLGNSVLFPLSVGACAVLEPAPSKPEVIAQRATRFGATLFFGGPTFFAGMLRTGLAADALAGVRLAVSAGEALPANLYERWSNHFGIDILDGIGMTEMLHIFLSNREGQVRPGTTGIAVPGYDLRVVDDVGLDVASGTPGTLLVRGASAALGYWSRYEATRAVFQGEWLRTGDTYVKDADGYYTCLGRTGDLLKPSGIWVSPAEIEAQLLTHDSVAQAIVVGALDVDGLEKPIAYVILHPGREATSEDELIEHCRGGLSSFKRPRRILFTDAFPTTSTGKIRRVELRARSAYILVERPEETGEATP